MVYQVPVHNIYLIKLHMENLLAFGFHLVSMHTRIGGGGKMGDTQRFTDVMHYALTCLCFKAGFSLTYIKWILVIKADETFFIRRRYLICTWF